MARRGWRVRGARSRRGELIEEHAPGAGLVVLLSGVLLAAGAGGFVYMERTRPAWALRGARPEVPPVVSVRTARPRRETEWLEVYGRCRSLRDAVIRSRVGGEILWIHPEVLTGSRLPAGTVVLRTEDGEARAALDEAQARHDEALAEQALLEVDHDHLEERLANARGSHEAARSELERIVALNARGAASVSDRDQQRIRAAAAHETYITLAVRVRGRKAEAERARARVSRAAAALTAARRHLDHHAVSIPFPGRCVERMVSAGATAQPGAPLFRLLDPRDLEVRLSIPASRRGLLAPGAPLRLRADPAGPVLWTGRIDRIDPALDPGTQTFGVYAGLRGGAATAPPLPTAGNQDRERAGGALPGELPRRPGSRPPGRDAKTAPAGAPGASGGDVAPPHVAIAEERDEAPAGGAPLVPGGFVVGEIALRVHDDVVVVPRSAYLEGRLLLVDPDPGGDGGTVRVYRPPGAVVLPDRVMLAGGPPAGSLIVISDPSRVGAGSRVRVRPEATPRRLDSRPPRPEPSGQPGS